jgi:DNA-binding response OmpR family regulator
MDVPAKILVVDDDLDTVNLLRLVLQRGGYKVATATSWEEVIDRVKTAEADRESFDLVILDIMMPGRTGFEVLLVLQVVLHPVPPVIFLSAKCGMDDMVKASELGAAKYLTKPTTPARLLAAVNEVLVKVKKPL